MIEVLVSSGIVCGICGMWWKNHINNKLYNQRSKLTDDMLDKFVEINSLVGIVDFELLDTTIHCDALKKKSYGATSITQIGQSEDTGYDFLHVKVSPGFSSLEHKHNFSAEFFYVLSGSIFVEICGKKQHQLNIGDYFYVKPHDIHCVTSDGYSEFILIAKPPMIVDK